MFPYAYFIFNLGQFQILGEANTSFFSKKKCLAFPFQLYGKKKDFRVFRHFFFAQYKYKLFSDVQ